MSSTLDPLAPPDDYTPYDLRDRWGWFLALGIALIILGFLFLFEFVLAAQFLVRFYGWLLIFGGAIQIVHSFLARRWRGFFLNLLFGVLNIVLGFLFLIWTDIAIQAVALLILLYFITGGLVRILLALMARFPHRVWVFITGAVGVVLGFILLSGWLKYDRDNQDFSEMIIGIFIGVEMLFNGFSLVMLALAARRLPKAPAPGPAV
jgi:uncharacterized membrane protein HdeD (DUF308 family)